MAGRLKVGQAIPANGQLSIGDIRLRLGNRVKLQLSKGGGANLFRRETCHSDA
jgi:hypothetical protein